MNRDFEVRQLLRADRSGILSETAFEEEMHRLEREEVGEHLENQKFEALGRGYRSERDAVLSLFDHLYATQIGAAPGFAKWAVNLPDARTSCRSRSYRRAKQFTCSRWNGVLEKLADNFIP
jgi:hypothetical protein